MTENKVTLNKLQFETKISISVTYKERELLVYNNYTNLLYTPKKDLEFSLIKKILGNTGNVFLKDLTEKLNPVLVFIDNLDITTTDDLNKELLIPLKQILPKSKIIENLEGLNRYELSKFSLNNFRKVSLQTLSELESLHTKKLEELNKSNKD